MNREEFYTFLAKSKYFKGGEYHRHTTGNFICHFMFRDNFDIKDYYSIEFGRNHSITLYRNNIELMSESMFSLISKSEEDHIKSFMNRTIESLGMNIKELLELE
jgi:hypothetical protein